MAKFLGTDVLNAMDELRIGTNTPIADYLDFPLHDTVALVQNTEARFHFFDKDRTQKNSDLAMTNNTQGNRVPSKQAWVVHGLAFSVMCPVALDEDSIAILNKFLFETSLKIKLDSDSTKYETTLSSLLGNPISLAPVATQNTVNNGLFTGVVKFPNYKINMGAETQFDFSCENKTAVTIPAELDGVKLRLELKRTLIKLV